MPVTEPEPTSGAIVDAGRNDDERLFPVGPDDASPSTVGTETVSIPINRAVVSFDDTLTDEMRHFDESAEAERLRRCRHWRHEIERMRRGVIRLDVAFGDTRSDRCRSLSPKTSRDRSPDLLPHHQPEGEFGRRRQFRALFDVAGCDPHSVRVFVESGSLIVVARKRPEVAEDGSTAGSTQGTPNTTPGSRKNGSSGARVVSIPEEVHRSVIVPPNLDYTRLESVLTADGILVVEVPRSGTGRQRQLLQSSTPSPAHAATLMVSPAASPSDGNAVKEKVGKPIFRDEDGQRRMHLVVDLGTTFRPKDIHLQVLKSDKFQIWAKRQFKTKERSLRAKYDKEFELTEKIVTRTLWARLRADGRLVVGAVTKRQPPPPTSTSSDVVDGGATPRTTADHDDKQADQNHQQGAVDVVHTLCDDQGNSTTDQ